MYSPFTSRFCDDQRDALNAMKLLPSPDMVLSHIPGISLNFYAADMPFPEDLDTEIHMWKVFCLMLLKIFYQSYYTAFLVYHSMLMLL